MPTALRSLLAVLSGFLLLLSVLLPAAFAQDMRGAEPIDQAERVRKQQEAVRGRIEEQLGPTKSFALVIGISDFGETGWSRLHGVPAEVEEVAAALEAQKFKVVKHNSGRMTKDGLNEAIAGFFADYGREGANRLVVYIATHGYAAPEGDRTAGYLVASDSGLPEAGSGLTAYSDRELRNAVDGAVAQHIMVFLNACYSGALIQSGTRGTPQVGVERKEGIAPLSPEVADWTLDLLSHNARLAISAGSDEQEVLDRDNPFSKAVIGGLNGAADADGDGIILGLELIQHIRSRVGPETRKLGRPNDPVFGQMPKESYAGEVRADLPEEKRAALDYRLQGDFVFLSPRGPDAAKLVGGAPETGFATVNEARNRRLPSSQFSDCPDCPVMVEIPEGAQDARRIAFGQTEVTFSEWDACYRELWCRFVDDGEQGRGDRPVGGLTYMDALNYVGWLNTRARERCEAYRLPEQPEWTAAALAGAQSRFAWGEAPGDRNAVCWGCGEGMEGAAPLGARALPANGYDLYQMAGNLWEWTAGRDDKCTLEQLGSAGACEAGTVVGGSYATRAADLAAASVGTVPRTASMPVRRSGSSALLVPYSLPTVGMRVACDLKAGEG